MKPHLRVGLLLCLFLSGATALVYEVIWTRRLTLTLGHSVLAVSAVLMTFMAGLGAGSYAGGRWADKHPGQCLRGYAYLELAIGVWGLLSLPLLGGMESIYLKLAAACPEAAWLPLAGCLGCVVSLLPPTLAMGATLPLLARGLQRRHEGVVRLVSTLYGWNTVGAVAGAAAAGFWLLPVAGMRTTAILAAAVNLIVGGLVMANFSSNRLEQVVGGTGVPHARPRRVLLAFGLTGCASMVYQVGWTRGLLLVIASSTYAFSAVLVTFLAGLGLGGLAAGRVRRPTESSLGWLQLALGVVAALSIVVLGYLPRLFFELYPPMVSSFPRLLALQVALCVAALLLPCLLIGLSFPIATELYAGESDLGSGIGELYAANTIGCIVGAGAAGFLLIPQLGCQSTLKFGVLLSLFAGGLLFRARGVGMPIILALAALTVALPLWDTAVLAGGVAVYAESYKGRTWSDVQRKNFLPPAFYRDGLSSTISIHFGGPDAVSFRVNGKTDGSLTVDDKRTMYLTGYLGGLLHPAPRTAAVIGFGTGMTLEALSHFRSLDHIDCAELEPAVMEASKYWIGHNGRVLEDPRLKIRVADGRTFIKSSARRYDLIVSEPSNVWMAGVGDLYTVEFFESCRRHLNPEGLMVQWFHIYGVSRAEVGTVFASFFEAFPEGAVWMSNAGDLLLVGGMRPVEIDLNHIRELYGASFAMRHRLFELGVLAPDWLAGHFLMGREQALALFPGADLNTDDHPVLEYRAPRHYDRRASGSGNLEFLLEARAGLPPGLSREAVLSAAQAWVNIGDYGAVQEVLQHGADADGSALLRARYLQAIDSPEAAEAYRSAVKLARGDARALAILAWVELEGAQGRLPRARELCRYLLRDHSEWDLLPMVLVSLGQCQLGLGEFPGAVAAFRQALKYPMPGSYVQTMLGIAYARGGNAGDASRAFDEALKINPYDLAAMTSLAGLDMQTGELESALKMFDRALALEPANPDLLLQKGACQLRAGDHESARDTFRIVLAHDPGNPVARRFVEQLDRGRPR